MNAYVEVVDGGFAVLRLISDDLLPNGLVTVRLADITSVKSPAPYHAFVEKILSLRSPLKHVPVPSQPLSWESLLRDLHERWPLVTVHMEVLRPDICYVGRVVAANDRSATFALIDPHGRWKKRHKVISFRDLTRLDVGGLYEEALAIVAGLVPVSASLIKAPRRSRPRVR